MKKSKSRQNMIHLGTHGEDYGNWMSNPVFYVVGALLALSAVLAVLSFTVFHITALGVVFRGCCSDSTGPVFVVCLDSAAVCFRGRRHDGSDPPGRPFPSGF